MRRGENQSNRRKTSQSRVENQQTQSTYDAGSGNRTRDTLVEGERSHHCANPARLLTLAKIGQSQKFPAFEHLNDIVNKTPCVKPEEKSYHLRECLNRECQSCGVEKLDLLKEEEDVSPQAPKVS